MTKYSVVIAALALAFPMSAFAEIQISEIMYNPKGSDTGREWIELYNAGSTDVSLTGGSGKGSWRIGDSSNHTIIDPSGGTGRGSLVIPAGGYLVIASDPTIFTTGEYAGGSYSVAKSSISLNNTGGTITLVDGSGSVIGSVAYTKDEGANDDGTSLQRQGDGSWIAGSPTPGAANTSTAYVAPDPTDSSSSTDSSASTTPDTDSSTQTSNQTAQAPVSSYVAPPQPTLFVDGGTDRTVIVGADTEYDGRAYDRQKTPVDRVRFLWNFGDGTTADGPAVLHHYDFPGKYEVVLTVAQNKDAQSDYFVVTAEPARLSFAANADGSVSIGNLAGRNLDLSGWIVRSVAERFILPENSIVLNGATLRLSARTLNFFATHETELDYPNGAFALPAGSVSDTAPASATPAVAAKPSIESAAAGVPTAEPKSIPAVRLKADVLAPAKADTPDQEDSTTTAFGQTAAVAAFSGSYWWLGALAIALLAGSAMVFVRTQRAGEWQIEEIEPVGEAERE